MRPGSEWSGRRDEHAVTPSARAATSDSRADDGAHTGVQARAEGGVVRIRSVLSVRCFDDDGGRFDDGDRDRAGFETELADGFAAHE